MKIWELIKTAIYLITGTAIIIFSDNVMPYISFFVGSIMVVYAVENIILTAMHKTFFYEEGELFEGVILLLFAFILLFAGNENIEKICTVWAVWSILRETKDFKDSLHKVLYRHSKPVNVIHCAESAFVIYLSTVMLLTPSLEHAHTHVILLGIELILEVLFPIADEILLKISATREQVKNHVINSHITKEGIANSDLEGDPSLNCAHKHV